jgi:predicted nucleotidyltransferase
MAPGSRIQLTERERRTVAAVLRQFGSRLGPVKVFGSRARGSARANSDLDLVVFPPSSRSDLRSLASAFEESDLSITVDLLAWESIESPALKDEIRRSAIAAPGSRRIR